jgi:hypothetical protein
MGAEPMSFTIVVLIALGAVALSLRARMTVGESSDYLGRMSAQWLVDHRASEKNR